MRFEGVYTALITAFHKSGTGIDEKITARLIERQIEAGVTGIILGGSTGEGQTLELNEIENLIKVAKAFKGKIQIMGACGFSGTQQTADRYAWLCKNEVDAVLISTPPYNKAPQRGLVRHFQEIAKLGDKPIMAYNIPGRTAVNLLPSTMKDIWKISQIAALKESSGSIEQIQQSLYEMPQGKSLFCGDDPLSLSVWALGASGTVSVLSNICPKALVTQWKAWKSGKISEAQEIQKKMMTLTQHLFVESNPIPTKFCMGQILKTELNPRLPLVSLDEAHHLKLKESLKLAASEGFCEAL